MKRVYICGPVSGLPYDVAKYNFDKAEASIKAMGAVPINPTNIVPAETTWNNAMRLCIKAMMDADMILLLDGWSASQGACLEVQLAQMLGIKVLEIKYFQSKMNQEKEEVCIGC
jgi:hypothetical protein